MTSFTPEVYTYGSDNKILKVSTTYVFCLSFFRFSRIFLIYNLYVFVHFAVSKSKGQSGNTTAATTLRRKYFLHAWRPLSWTFRHLVEFSVGSLL